MNRLTRLFVILSMLAAGAVEATLAAREWAPLTTVTGVAFLVAFAAGRFLPRATPALALLFTYVAPAVVTAILGRFRLPYLLVWIAGLAGAMLATRPLGAWALPPRWKWPLATWALVVSAAWPILVLRELDFNLALVEVGRIANSMAGGLPTEAAEAIARAAVAQGVGILFFDWLYDRYRNDPIESWRRFVLAPLAASAIVACLLGAYQGFIDMTFLSGGNWAALGRAAGSMVDANSFGMIAALWTAGLVALALQTRMRGRLLIAAAGFALAWIALWSSGSRSALLVGAIGFVFVAAHICAALPSRATRFRALAAAAVVATFGLGALTLAPSEAMGPLRRAFSALPAPTPENAGRIAAALWNRNYYGAAATIMIREHPLVGVGVGAFNQLSPDYTHLAGSRETFDNAQNWYRHQFAELGLVGSAGWILWVALFIATLARTRGEGDRRVPAGAVKGALVGVGAISMFGVPAQSAAVTLTFWALAFWYLALAVPREGEPRPHAPRRSAWGWGLVCLLVLVHGAGTTVAARHTLSVPERARRIGWAYTYGFYDLERPPGGAPFRWTARTAVTIVAAERGWLKLRLWVAHPDAHDRPVDVRVWCGDVLVVQRTLRDGAPVTEYVPVPAGQSRLILRTWVSRTWRPSEFGSRDARELGVAVTDWVFVEERPSGVGSRDAAPKRRLLASLAVRSVEIRADGRRGPGDRRRGRRAQRSAKNAAQSTDGSVSPDRPVGAVHPAHRRANEVRHVAHDRSGFFRPNHQ